MNQSELVSFLHEIGATPRKTLSQNFLIDQNIVAKIAELAEIRPKDNVLEIGSGPGAITKKLLLSGANVLAVEMDRLFSTHLLRFQTFDNRLSAQCADFLEFPIDFYINSENSNALGALPLWKAVSNLPFQVTAPILEKLCDHARFFSSFTIVVQKEVGERIRAKPRTKEFGSLTVFLAFYTQFIDSFPISATCFYPRPKVESMAIRLDVRNPPDICPKVFFPIVRKAFQQRRKMLSSSLRFIDANIKSILKSLGLSENARPEELSLDAWVAFVQSLPLPSTQANPL